MIVFKKIKNTLQTAYAIRKAFSPNIAIQISGIISIVPFGEKCNNKI